MGTFGASRRSKILWLAKIGLSVVLIGYLLRSIGFEETIVRARELTLLAACGALVFVLLQCFLGAVRWNLIISAIGGHLGIDHATRITAIGLFLNQFLPASVGTDVARVWQSVRFGITPGTAVTSVMLERFTNLLAILAMTGTSLSLLSSRAPSEGRIIVAVAGGICVGGLVALMSLDRFVRGGDASTVARAFVKVARDTRALLLKPRYACLVIACAVAGQVALASAVWALCAGLSVQVRFVDCVLVMPAVALLSSLPISIAGWGVRELAMVGALAIFSVPADAALAVSIILALTVTIVSLPGAIVWLMLRRHSASSPRRLSL